MSFQLKIELKDSEPKIYRTVVVPEHFNFCQLHRVIQCVMNWEDYHLYEFSIGAVYNSDIIAEPDPENDDFGFWGSRHKKYDASETYLADFFNGQCKKMTYIYDLGDSWTHIIKPLKKPKVEAIYPKCIKGEGTAPVEDCGGMSGFYDLLEILGKKGKSEEKQEMKDWLELGPRETYESVFGYDIDHVNKKLLEEFSN